jgi:hypothetical protein
MITSLNNQTETSAALAFEFLMAGLETRMNEADFKTFHAKLKMAT